jgi:repressor LexA
MINLKKFRTAKGVSQATVAKELGISRQTYNNYELGKRQADYETLLKLAEYFETTVEELITDRQKNAPDPITALTDHYDNIFPVKLKRFPMLGEIACGEPIFACEDRENFVMADMDIRADFCLRAKGDSMVGARINDGDIVFIRQMPIVDNGEIAAVIINDEATLKRVYYYPEKAKLILSPENPKYEPFVYIGEELDHVRILGQAVYFMSSL